jgi:hypothetical protein
LAKSLGNKRRSYSTDDIKNIVQAKLKENLWCDKEADKIKLRY